MEEPAPRIAKRFEDLVSWQKARLLTKSIYQVTRHHPFDKDFRLVGQITSASTSIMSNLAEGFEKRSKSEFHQAVVHAKGSAGEVRSQLYVALDAGYLNETEFNMLQNDVEEVSRLLEGLRAGLDKSRSSRST